MLFLIYLLLIISVSLFGYYFQIKNIYYYLLFIILVVSIYIYRRNRALTLVIVLENNESVIYWNIIIFSILLLLNLYSLYYTNKKTQSALYKKMSEFFEYMNELYYGIFHHLKNKTSIFSNIVILMRNLIFFDSFLLYIQKLNSKEKLLLILYNFHSKGEYEYKIYYIKYIFYISSILIPKLIIIISLIYDLFIAKQLHYFYISFILLILSSIHKSCIYIIKDFASFNIKNLKEEYVPDIIKSLKKKRELNLIDRKDYIAYEENLLKKELNNFKDDEIIFYKKHYELTASAIYSYFIANFCYGDFEKLIECVTNYEHEYNIFMRKMNILYYILLIILFIIYLI